MVLSLPSRLCGVVFPCKRRNDLHTGQAEDPSSPETLYVLWLADGWLGGTTTGGDEDTIHPEDGVAAGAEGQSRCRPLGRPHVGIVFFIFICF